MARYSLHAVGTDRPGIVAKVTGVLAEAGCNLEDSRMAILSGQFAIMLVVETPDSMTAIGLEESFSAVQAEYDLLIVLRPLVTQEETVDLGETLSVSIHGGDRLGIVAAVTEAIASLGGNIVDLTTHKIPSVNGASYVLLLSVESGPQTGEQRMREELDIVARRLGVTCVVHSGTSDLL